MGLNAIFDSRNWQAIPFHFWSAVFFTLGCIVGSFLNVVIYRLPLGQSIVSPPSHCPHCRYSIPWYLNVPLLTWVYLRGRCRNCRAPISVRYFLVELLTGLLFLGCWLGFGRASAAQALVYCILLSLLIAATFIDFEHFIIPDEITIGGAVAGFFCSLLLPRLHERETGMAAAWQSVLGIVVGAGMVYGVVRLGKLMFGRYRITLPGETKIVFGETSLHLPDREIPFEELFYRRTDVITLHARTVELPDRCYKNTIVRLTPEKLSIGDEEFKPEDIAHMEAVSTELILPREAMGLGDVKFMATIGAFLGWQATVFSLLVSSMIGSVLGIALILLRKREWSARLPYGPYIAAAAVIWVFAGRQILEMIFPQ